MNSELQTQFLCCVPIKKIHWKNTLKYLSWDEQKRLLDETVNLIELQKYPLDTNYVIRFLKYIINDLESQCIDIHDEIYTTLCSLQSKSNENANYCYKHYRIQVDSNVTCESVIIKENRNKISKGTTGLNSWESSLALSEWSVQNKDMLNNKNILELGSGTGTSGIIIAKFCSPKSICITDGHDKVMENLLENVSNNFEKLNDKRFYFANTIIDVMKLNWTTINEEFIMKNLKKIDLIIASDVIYDNSLFDSLLTTVKMLFDYCDNCKQFMLMNAVRNTNTEHEFLTKLDEFGLWYQEEESIITAKLFYWEPNQFSPIKLYSIFKDKTN